MRRTLLVPLVIAAGLLVLGGPASAQDDERLAGDRPGLYVINRPASLYSRPSVDSRIILKIPPQTVVKVVSVTEQWYEVRSTRGKPGGWIRRSYAEPHAGGRRRSRRVFRPGVFRLTDPAIMRAEPDIDSRRVTTLREGAEVRVVDKRGNWYRVESASGDRPAGWIPTISAKRTRDLDSEEAAPRARRPEERPPRDLDRDDEEERPHEHDHDHQDDDAERF